MISNLLYTPGTIGFWTPCGPDADNETHPLFSEREFMKTKLLKRDILDAPDEEGNEKIVMKILYRRMKPDSNRMENTENLTVAQQEESKKVAAAAYEKAKEEHSKNTTPFCEK